MRRIASESRPVSCSVLRNASTSEPRHGCAVVPDIGIHGRGVYGIDPRLDRGNNRGAGKPGCVVGVEVDRQIDGVLQSSDKHPSSPWFQEPRHILDTEHVNAGALRS